MSKDDLIQFMQTDLGIDTADLEEHTLLFSSGIIDSFSLVSLISFIEKKLNFRVNPTEVNLDNFDSVERILGFVKVKTSAV